MQFHNPNLNPFEASLKTPDALDSKIENLRELLKGKLALITEKLKYGKNIERLKELQYKKELFAILAIISAAGVVAGITVGSSGATLINTVNLINNLSLYTLKVTGEKQRQSNDEESV